jgi:hypothetical protein
VELALVILGQGAQDSVTLWREMQGDAAAIWDVVPAMDETGVFTAFAEFYDGVVTEA